MKNLAFAAPVLLLLCVTAPDSASAATFQMTHDEILARGGFNNYFTTLPEFTAFVADPQRIDFEGAWLPHSTPGINVNSFYNVVPRIGDLYLEQGVRFDNDVAIHGGQTGFGWLTRYAVAGNTANGVGPIGFTFVDPITGIAAPQESVLLSVADGPKGDFAVDFFNGNQLLTTLLPEDLNNARSVFGYNDERGITRVVVRQQFPDLDGGPDDIFIDDLIWGHIPVVDGGGGGGPGAEVPEPTTLLLFGGGLMGLLSRKRQSADS